MSSKNTNNSKKQKNNSTIGETNPKASSDSKMSIRSEGSLFSVKSISEEETSVIEDDEQIRKEAEKRAQLNGKPHTYQTETTKSIRKSTDVLIESITKELPKDVAGCMIWLNIIAGVLSIILLTVIWAIYLQGQDETKTQKLLVTLSMALSITGQFLCWLGTVRSIWKCLVASIGFLALEVLISMIVVVIYLTYISQEFDSIVLFQIVVLIVIMGLSIATIVLSIFQIQRLSTLDKISQTQNKTIIQ